MEVKMNTQREKLWNVKILFALILSFALSVPALAAAYDFLTGDNSTFDTTIGDWSASWPDEGVSWVATPFHTASGAAKVTSYHDPGAGNLLSSMESACYNIDYANWPGEEKSITFSGYVKNESMPSISPSITFYQSANCPFMPQSETGSAITSSDWTSFSFSFR